MSSTNSETDYLKVFIRRVFNHVAQYSDWAKERACISGSGWDWVNYIDGNIMVAVTDSIFYCDETARLLRESHPELYGPPPWLCESERVREEEELARSDQEARDRRMWMAGNIAHIIESRLYEALFHPGEGLAGRKHVHLIIRPTSIQLADILYDEELDPAIYPDNITFEW